MREVTRVINKRYLNEKPLCLVPTCNNFAQQYKNGNYRNYCEDHSYEDMQCFTNWQMLRLKIIKRDKKCLKCNDDREFLQKEKLVQIWNKDLIMYEDKIIQHNITNFEVDHIKEVSIGGDLWDENNLQTLCKKCHKEKTAAFLSKLNKKI